MPSGSPPKTSAEPGRLARAHTRRRAPGGPGRGHEQRRGDELRAAHGAPPSSSAAARCAVPTLQEVCSPKPTQAATRIQAGTSTVAGVSPGSGERAPGAERYAASTKHQTKTAAISEDGH